MASELSQLLSKEPPSSGPKGSNNCRNNSWGSSKSTDRGNYRGAWNPSSSFNSDDSDDDPDDGPIFEEDPNKFFEVFFIVFLLFLLGFLALKNKNLHLDFIFICISVFWFRDLAPEISNKSRVRRLLQEAVTVAQVDMENSL